MSDCVRVDELLYPGLLKLIPDPPDCLYFRGDFNENMFIRCLAVVGSRRMSTYGRRVAEKLVYEVASSGVTIVSGFMYGIDAVAHKTALDAGGKTIAVLPGGIECVSPPYHKSLYERIIDSGSLIVSEYDGDVAPQIWSYPRRNRIIVGLSKVLLVVEAGEGSGSLVSAGLAKKYGREILAVPGCITSSNSAGTLELISRGAKMVRSSEDVLEGFKG